MSIRAFLGRAKRRALRVLKGPAPTHNPWQEKQDRFMRDCFTNHNVRPKGILHVGGHLGEEYAIYKSLGAEKIVFFEPIPRFYDELKERFKKNRRISVVKNALGSRCEKRDMHVHKSTGESSSFLQPSELYDGFFEPQRLTLEVITLDDFLKSTKESQIFDLLVTDTQGFDLEVLKGASDTLKQIKYVYTEVSHGHYIGEPSLEDFDRLLLPRGFRRAALSMYGSWKGDDQWGDVFYIKDELPS